MCRNPEKMQYLTLRDAAGAALEQLDHHGAMRPYICADHWHLTSHDRHGSGFAPEAVRLLAKHLEVAR